MANKLYWCKAENFRAFVLAWHTLYTTALLSTEDLRLFSVLLSEFFLSVLVSTENELGFMCETKTLRILLFRDSRGAMSGCYVTSDKSCWQHPRAENEKCNALLKDK